VHELPAATHGDRMTTRVFRFTVVGVIYIISAVIHRMAVELFAPESPLHALASDGTAVMNGAARADLWFQILSIWIPLLAMGGVTAWLLVTEYRTQTITAARQRPPR
jgi:hypothetical protein